ncbi:MAG: aminotransferase class V-fold PLP-dependent enzyme [Flavipsychrobacter sp.]|nr:aminotransferase class V-fold PLP-dependent enzyme [Flavipsychrobacter sp.]
MTPDQPIYLNTASCGLITPESLAAGHELYKDFEHNSSARSEVWRMLDEARIRQTIATFIGADAKDVAMVPNFSWAMNAVVQSLKGTERVLLYARDYPSFLEPFRINQFDITWVDAPDGFNIEMDVVRDAIRNKKVDIVALSHVQWSSGYKIDLKEIGDLCREHGVLFVVDATQSLGANLIDLSALNIDVFAASHYKWMNAGFGNGTLYVADSFLKKYPPVVGGHNSYKMVGDEWKYVASAQSYEPGSPNMFGLTVTEAAINHKNKLGMPFIAQHNLQLTALLLNGLKDTPVKMLGDHTMANRCPIVYLVDVNGLGDHLKQHNIVVTHRNRHLRVSMHFHNTEKDVMALVGCVKEFYSK